MNRLRTALLVGATGCLFGFVACTGDDITLGPDAGPPKTDATVDQSTTTDATVDAGIGARLLMTYSTPQAGELVAYNTQTKAVDGRYAPPPYAVVEQAGADRFVIEGNQDLVYLLDPTSPWTVKSSWSMSLSDAVDGGESYADPVQVIEVSPTKAYVLRYNRDKIAIIDPTQSADAGAPIGSVDISSFKHPNNPEAFAEMVGAVFDPTRNRLYIAFGNFNLGDVAADGFTLLCGNTVSTFAAIDTNTDLPVNLGAAGPGGAVVLNGYGPQFGFLGGVILDAVGDRVLVVSGGCNATASDGGVGALSGRLIEAVDLKTNTTSTLLDANAQQYPGELVYIDGAHALVQFGFPPYATTFSWIPTQSTLGPALQTTPDLFALDYANLRIVGPQSTLTLDGGPGPTNVIAVPITSFDGGGVVTFGQNPFLQSGGYLGSVVYVP